MKAQIRLPVFLVWSFLASAFVTTASTPAQDCEPLQDFTSIKLEDYGTKPVEQKEDSKTGFIVGGKNATELIARPMLAMTSAVTGAN